jgi:hypothetical protein
VALGTAGRDNRRPGSAQLLVGRSIATSHCAARCGHEQQRSDWYGLWLGVHVRTLSWVGMGVPSGLPAHQDSTLPGSQTAPHAMRLTMSQRVSQARSTHAATGTVCADHGVLCGRSAMTRRHVELLGICARTGRLPHEATRAVVRCRLDPTHHTPPNRGHAKTPAHRAPGSRRKRGLQRGHPSCEDSSAVCTFIVQNPG